MVQHKPVFQKATFVYIGAMVKSLLKVSWAALGLASCAPVLRQVEASAPKDALSQVAKDYWEERAVVDPLSATYLGDRRYDAKLPDISEAGQRRHREVLEGLQKRMGALSSSSLSPAEQITFEVLEHELETERAEEVCQFHHWRIDQMAGPQVSFAELPTYHTVSEPAHLESLLLRYRGFRPYFQAHLENLRQGLKKGLVAARINVEKVLAQLRLQQGLKVDDSPYVASVALPSAWTDAQRAEARARLSAAVSQSVYPALADYAAFLEKVILPRARNREVGVSHLPQGPECYRARARGYTGTSKTPDELHALGLLEVERLGREREALVREAGETGTVGDYLRAQKGRVGASLSTSEALLEYNRALVERAQRVLPRAFGRLPKTRLEVKEIEAFRAKESPAGYYYNAPSDNSRPAYFYLNTWAPSSRPLYNMAALAFHEGVPGHHLQIALANENQDIPEFQRQLGPTAFVEGWALYAERLAGELGLYETVDEKLGALNYEMWRAVRLVVDTGLHAKGWTREQALAFFGEKTAHSEQESIAEVERYIVWPGQALAYKVGQMEILAIRESAQKALGASFDLRAFHDRLLSNGAVPLSTVRRDIEAWVRTHSTRP